MSNTTRLLVAVVALAAACRADAEESLFLTQALEPYVDGEYASDIVFRPDGPATASDRPVAVAGVPFVLSTDAEGNWRSVDVGPSRWREMEKTSLATVEPVKIDGALPGGDRFTGFQQFRNTLMAHEEDLACNMVESLQVYALGRDVEFTDEPHIEKILAELRPKGFRMKDMIHAVAESPLFFTN